MSPFDAVFREHQDRIWRMAGAITRGRGGKPALEDLVAVGNLALWTCHERHDPSQGTTLWQYAYLRVRGAMLDELRRRDLVSRDDRKKMKDLGTSVLEQVPWAALYPVPMEDAEHVPSGNNPEDEAIRAERFEMGASSLERLDPSDRQILQAYCLGGVSMQEIGDGLGVTESRVCQIIHRACDRLGDIMREGGIVDEAVPTGSPSLDPGKEESHLLYVPRGKGKTLTHDGLTMSVCGWAKKLGWSPVMIYSRIKAGWTTEKILTTPSARLNRHCHRSPGMFPDKEIARTPGIRGGGGTAEYAAGDGRLGGAGGKIEGVALDDKAPDMNDPEEVLAIRQRCWRLDQIDSQIAALMIERQEIVAALSPQGISKAPGMVP